MSRFVYADNAATTRLSAGALAAMQPYLHQNYGNPSSLYRFGQLAKAELEEARASVAAALGAQPEEIFFTSGGTEADNWAIRGAAELATLKKNPGKHIITSGIEHHAVQHTLLYLEKQGYEVTWLPVDAEGRIDPAAVQAAITPSTILITIMAANNEVGTIQPIAEIGQMARKAGVLFHTDAVQAVGHIPVDVEMWAVDMLSLSAHKFGGPRGVGALYVKKYLRLPPLLHGGGQEMGRRSGTENVAGCIGLAAALQEALAHMPAEAQRLTALRDKLLDGLSALPKSHVTGSRTHRLPGLASVIFECIEGESMVLQLDARGICASSGSACSSTSLEPSHVLLALGLPHEIAHGSVRLSLGSDTTEDDVDYILAQLPLVVANLRAMSPLWDEPNQP